MIATTRPEMSVSEPTLYVAFELGKKDWKLAMTSGFGIEPWVRTVPSGDLARGGTRAARGAATPGRAGQRAGDELLRSGARRVLDSSRVDAAGPHQSRRRFGEHRGESAGTARQNGSSRRAQVGAHAGAGVLRGDTRME